MSNESKESGDSKAPSGKGSDQDKAEAKKPAKPVTVEFQDFIIHCDEPLPAYNHGPVLAYKAEAKSKESGSYFALVCMRHLVPRHKSAELYNSIMNPMLAPLAGNGVVYWPPAQQERYILVYKDVLGKRLLEPGMPRAMGWRPEEVMKKVAIPMIGVLQDFRDRNFFHGSIRPSNLYDGGQLSTMERAILGDALALPCSYSQPVIYETIDRGMVKPAARGRGTLSDDLYSFGVTLAVMMRHNDPLKDVPEDEIVRAKLEMGSYVAITGKDRFKGSILELLRGVLHDDAGQRWGLEEVLAWMDGRRLSPKQPVKVKKAARPISFAGQKYLYCVQLAMDLENNPPETQRIVESEDLEQWLSRSLEDDETLERVQQAVKLSREKGTGPGYEDRLVANVSTALDPKSPIRFKGLKLLGDGVGYGLAETMILGQDVSSYAEFFVQNVAMNWLTLQRNNSVDVGTLIPRFDSCRNFLRQPKIGYGIERSLYTLNTEVHCISDKLSSYFVRSSEDVVLAFEDMGAKKKTLPSLFIDRHIAAFISVKDPKSIDAFLFDLGTEENHKKILANLKCFATIQKRSNLPMLPHLGRAFYERLAPVFTRYHDRTVQEKIKSSVERFSADGDLVKMAGVLDNGDVIKKDQTAFQQAMREYIDLCREEALLGSRLDSKDTFGKGTGNEISALISSVIAAIIILGTLFMFLSDHASF